jgi:nucleoside-diphosphate-sugar epimerase
MRHGKYGILNWFIRLAMDNQKITVYEPGTQTREYNYIDDAAEAMILASQNPKAIGDKFLVSSGEEIPFVDLVRLVVKTVQSGEVVMVPWPKERAVIESGNFHVNMNKIQTTLGWHPTTPLTEGLKKTVNFYRKRKADYF